MKRPLRALAPGEKRGVIVRPQAPAMKGSGADDWTCPTCSTVLVRRVDEADLARMINAAFKCPKCGTVSTHEAPIQ